MIRNPFTVKVVELPDDNQKNVIELLNDRNCKDTFESSMKFEVFGCRKAIAYLNLREILKRYLVIILTTYLCEQ